MSVGGCLIKHCTDCSVGSRIFDVNSQVRRRCMQRSGTCPVGGETHPSVFSDAATKTQSRVCSVDRAALGGRPWERRMRMMRSKISEAGKSAWEATWNEWL